MYFVHDMHGGCELNLVANAQLQKNPRARCLDYVSSVPYEQYIKEIHSFSISKNAPPEYHADCKDGSVDA